MPDTAAFCEKCGAKTGIADISNTDSTAAIVKDKHKKIITIATVITAVIAAAIIGAVAMQATPANRLKKQLRLAQKYLNEMNYEQAVLAYKEAISIDPKCEEAYFAIADIYIKTNEEDKAVEILEQAQAYIQTGALSARLDEVRRQAAAAKEERESGGSTGQNGSGQGGNTGTSPTQSQPTTTALTQLTQAATEAVTEKKEYTLEDAKADAAYHFKRLDTRLNGTYFINDDECRTDENGYYMIVRYKLGRAEINTGYGVSNNIYVAYVFIEKDTKMLEYLDAQSPFHELTQGAKIQLN